MTDTKLQLGQTLTKMLDMLKDVAPEAIEIMAQLKAQEISEVDAMTQLMLWAKDHPDIMETLQHSITKSNALANIAKTELTPFFEDRRDDGKLPRLNPIFEAALTERLQFDGDAPELRSGPLPLGAMPAVPISTNARNPVSIGKGLDMASRNTMEAIEAHREEKARALGLIPPSESIGTALVLSEEKQRAAMALWESPDMDLPAYKRGEAAAPVAVDTLSGSYLAEIPPEDAQHYTWKFLSTTQGRRSVVPTILEMVIQRLEKAGVMVSLGTKDETPVAFERWTFKLDGTANTQPKFAYVDTAAKVLGESLVRQLKEKHVEGCLFHLDECKNIADREVGWLARCFV